MKSGEDEERARTVLVELDRSEGVQDREVVPDEFARELLDGLLIVVRVQQRESCCG